LRTVRRPRLLFVILGGRPSGLGSSASTPAPESPARPLHPSGVSRREHITATKREIQGLRDDGLHAEADRWQQALNRYIDGETVNVAIRWSELPHASHTALPGQLCLLCPFGSSAPLHFEHLCSGHAKQLEFRWSELPHALHRGLHSRAEWPVSPHVLHTRYGHVPLFWRCPDCAHNVQ
jgi:hypothetical protein